MRRTKNRSGITWSAISTLLIICAGLVHSPLSAQNAQGGAKPGGNGVGSEFELVFWQSVAGSDDRDQLAAYLLQYPNGTFSALAKAKMAGLDRRAPPPAAVMPAAAVQTAAVQAVVPVSSPPQMAVAQAVAAIPVAQPAPAPAPPPSPAPVLSLSQQLHQLSEGQGLKVPGSMATASRALIPAAPALKPVPAVALPDHFCSAVARNAFYDESYRPVVDIADRNNQAAIAYLDALQALHNDLTQRGDIDAMNAVAVESQSYKPTAAKAFQERSGFEDTYTRLMAVPIQACPAGGN